MLEKDWQVAILPEENGMQLVSSLAQIEDAGTQSDQLVADQELGGQAVGGDEAEEATMEGSGGAADDVVPAWQTEMGLNYFQVVSQDMMCEEVVRARWGDEGLQQVQDLQTEQNEMVLAMALPAEQEFRDSQEGDARGSCHVVDEGVAANGSGQNQHNAQGDREGQEVKDEENGRHGG